MTIFHSRLEIKPGATEEEIKKAYLKKAHLTHPDKGGSEEEFGKIKEAYDVLIEGALITEDTFTADVLVGIEVSVEEIMHDYKTKIKFQTLIPCPQCKGSVALEYSEDICFECVGKGKHKTGLTYKQCVDCQGTGKEIKRRCSNCGIDGTVKEDQEYTLKIKPDTRPGTIFKLEGLGNKGGGINIGKTGDLLVEVNITETKQMSLDYPNTISTVPLDYKYFAQGITLPIQTASGEQKIVIPPNTSPTTPFIIEGAGLPGGDHIINFNCIMS